MLCKDFAREAGQVAGINSDLLKRDTILKSTPYVLFTYTLKSKKQIIIQAYPLPNSAEPIAMQANREAFALAVQQVMASGNVLLGAQTTQFEKAFALFAGTQHGVAVSSGAAALQLSLAALGIGEGDEVIVPAMTAVPTASAVCAVGARPIIVDVDEETAAIDLDLVEAAMTERTRAVIAVHLYGRPVANLDRLMNLGVKVIEDCAQSHGATRGLSGSIGAYSFYPTKS